MAYVAVADISKPPKTGATELEKLLARGTFPAFGLGNSPEEAANCLKMRMAVSGALVEGLVFTPWPPRIFKEVEGFNTLNYEIPLTSVFPRTPNTPTFCENTSQDRKSVQQRYT